MKTASGRLMNRLEMAKKKINELNIKTIETY